MAKQQHHAEPSSHSNLTKEEVIVVKEEDDETASSSSYLERLRQFQHQNHSLRISVSNIAAMTGFHPFRSLPELMLKLVYQGSMGQRLLRHDAKLLQLEMVDETAILIELANKASVETSLALQVALQVKMGTTTLDTIQKARDIKKRIVEEAKKTNKLSKDELRLLEEGSRSAVDTGYGTCHEGTALDLYELKCGWPVRDRNAEILIWPFQRIPIITSQSTNSNEASNASSSWFSLEAHDATAIPIASPSHCWKQNMKNEASDAEVIVIDDDDDDCDESKNRQEAKRPKTDESGEIQPQETIDGREYLTGEKDKHGFSHSEEELSPETPPPFFSILGSVDGIREEMFPISNDNDVVHCSPGGDDDWQIRLVIVECKHRMNKIHPIPPLYEQIQTTAYCLMYQVTEADIIQVIRKEGQEDPKQSNNTKTTANTNGNAVVMDHPLGGNNKQQSTMLSYFQTAKTNATAATDSSMNADVPQNQELMQAQELEQQQQQQQEQQREQHQQPVAQVEIAVNRVSIDDPLYQHRCNWEKIVLPRLCSFVDAVYRIRASDVKRYQWLVAMASSSQHHQQQQNALQAWSLLYQECPWLQSCDTAFRREVSYE